MKPVVVSKASFYQKHAFNPYRINILHSGPSVWGRSLDHMSKDEKLNDELKKLWNTQ